MIFERSQHPKDTQTCQCVAIQVEKEREIMEYQRPFLVAFGIIKEDRLGSSPRISG